LVAKLNKEEERLEISSIENQIEEDVK